MMQTHQPFRLTDQEPPSGLRPEREPSEQGYLELRSFDSKGAEIVDRIECKPRRI